MIKKINFTSGRYRLAGNLVSSENEKKTLTILICHGAGAANKERFLELQKLLLEKGFASFAFDFTGVGESEGKFEEGTLHKRLQDAQAALDFLSDNNKINKEKIVVIGTSMGGHIAARLTEKNQNLKGVVLLYAAAYGKEAEDKLLNKEFTDVIRKHNSWKNSPAFSALERYKGNILVVYGDEDRIVPQGVKEAYASLVKDRRFYQDLKGGGHLLLSASTPQEEGVNNKTLKILFGFLDKVSNTL